MTNTIPSRLGKYDVLSEINRGSMGIVYFGHDPYLDRDVAIKVALAEQLADPEMGDRYRKMFFNEAHTAGRLTHPNIIGIYDAGVDGETCYIVMEYVEGGATLKQYTRPETLLPIEKVVEIVFKCAKALDYAHKQGVIHRDIKPTNILVTQDLDVKIGDFSIAHLTKLDSTETMPMGMIGSPRYMSPEQVSEDYLTNHTDIFSLGIIIYELLTGRHPFYAENFSRLVQKILNEHPPKLAEFRSGVPPELEAIVNKALAKDRNERYQMGVELAADLSRAFNTLLDTPADQLTAEEQFIAAKRLDFFQGFPDSEIWEIVRAGNWQEYAPADEIIIEGEIDDSFYIIVDGEVTVRKGGRELRALSTGDCFGEMGYLAKTKRTATIIANARTSLMKVNSTVISQVSLNCQVRFLKVFLRTLIQRLSMTTELVSQDAD
ncbi:MAG: protein kinase [Gammaproteobacteria bacterium]|nr:protein kinase [Gammaproteobacteria bacterium]